jgi:predicted 3-demethylubiquinone-9 3-methyltransferase (glyoxalase superfamily)
MDDWKFNGATSFFINCETQKEVDHYWEKLSEGGQTNQCGWLTDQFGITWQVVPTILSKVLSDPDRVKADRAMQAMLKMTKFDIAELENAYAGT